MTIHTPILVEPIVDALVEPFRLLPENSPTHWLLDCTFGGGGHTAAFLEAFDKNNLNKHRILALDQDPLAIKKGKDRFKTEIAAGRLQITEAHFGEFDQLVKGKPVLGILADLGFSSDQMGDPTRGLSFKEEGPLDMRMDPNRGETAYEYLQHVSEEELRDALLKLGEERFSRRIAAAIIRAKNHGELRNSTKGLSDIVVRSIPGFARHGRIHAATRTFQALRIVVNNELGELDNLLKHAILFLERGGRIAILSFHSLEDRIVKWAIKNEASKLRAITKKPITASEKEEKENPRSRSAKLRIAERI